MGTIGRQVMITLLRRCRLKLSGFSLRLAWILGHVSRVSEIAFMDHEDIGCCEHIIESKQREFDWRHVLCLSFSVTLVRKFA